MYLAQELEKLAGDIDHLSQSDVEEPAFQPQANHIIYRALMNHHLSEIAAPQIASMSQVKNPGFARGQGGIFGTSKVMTM